MNINDNYKRKRKEFDIRDQDQLKRANKLIKHVEKSKNLFLKLYLGIIITIPEYKNKLYLETTDDLSAKDKKNSKNLQETTMNDDQKIDYE